MPDPLLTWEEGGYPPSSFYFRVRFAGGMGISDVSFQDVSGIGWEISAEPVVEGGENRYVHQLPIGVKHPNLVLKRGVAKKNSGLVKWCVSVLEKFEMPIKTKALLVQLLDKKGYPIRVWSIAGAYPVKWEIENMNSTKNEVLIETIELSYTTLSRTETS